MKTLKTHPHEFQFYRATIEEILIECEHKYRLTLDYELMDLKIEELFKNSAKDEINPTDLWSIIQQRIPSYINYKNVKSSLKKIA